MERYKRILLLLALSYWLVPLPTQAQQKYEFVYLDTQPVVNDEDWVMEGDRVVAEQLYQQWLQNKKPRQQLKKPTNYNACSCVSYARWRSGINVGSIGVARNHPVNSQTPSIGAIAITYESSAGHLSYIVDIDANYIYVDEANYSRCRVTYRRAIPINSKLIKGYYK